MIYFVQRQDEELLVKIGTTIDLKARLITLNRDQDKWFGNRAPLTVLGVMDGGPADEAALHQKFASYRRIGEWFASVDVIMIYAREELRPWDGTEGMVITKLDAEVARLARLVAQSEGKSTAEYLTALISPLVQRDAHKLGAKLTKPQDE